MFSTKKEAGQTIVLIAVMLFGLMAVSALIVDGGAAYVGRRVAQTAADAGALAGAREYCIMGNDPTAVITEYVETQNDATLESWAIVDGQIVVTVQRTHENFFAKVFGTDTTTVRADASAGCFSIGFAGGLLPIAWTCRPPQVPGDYLGGDECAMKGIPQEILEEIKGGGFEFDKYLLDEGDGVHAATYMDDIGGSSQPKMVYLIADSLKVAGLLEDVCIELNPPGEDPTSDPPNPPGAGTIDCDFAPEDGILDVDGGARRGWLLMDGDDNQGAAILFCIIEGEDPVCEVATDTPRWFAGLSGGKASAFGRIRDVREGDYAMIPIFDAICDTDDPVNDLVNCPDYYSSGENVVYANGTADYLYFRVNGFAVFYISCVSKTNADKCPGKNRAISHNVIDHNTATVEGYFIEYYVPNNVGIGENSLDLGVYIISLTE